MNIVAEAAPNLSLPSSTEALACDSCHIAPPLEGYDSPLCSECLSAHFKALPGYRDNRREFQPICAIRTKQGRVRPSAPDEEYYEGVQG